MMFVDCARDAFAEFTNYSENICMSGGADGADIFWGNCAKKHKHKVVHWSFYSHKSKASDDVYILNQDDLNIADEFLVKANKTLKRRFPSLNDHVNNLLRRNFYQICFSKSVYGVGFLEFNEVKGGTAWAIELMKLKGGDCYLFDQHQEKWFKWNYNIWIEFVPPCPNGIYAGIGSRDLWTIGKKAIQEIFMTNS